MIATQEGEGAESARALKEVEAPCSCDTSGARQGRVLLFFAVVFFGVVVDTLVRLL